MACFCGPAGCSAPLRGRSPRKKSCTDETLRRDDQSEAESCCMTCTCRSAGRDDVPQEEQIAKRNGRRDEIETQRVAATPPERWLARLGETSHRVAEGDQPCNRDDEAGHPPDPCVRDTEAVEQKSKHRATTGDQTRLGDCAHGLQSNLGSGLIGMKDTDDHRESDEPRSRQSGRADRRNRAALFPSSGRLPCKAINPRGGRS
jgi:hypothetical protein